MEIFINEQSLNGQYWTEEEFTEAIIKFTSIVSLIKQGDCKGELFQDRSFVYDREAIHNQPFLSSIEKIKDKFIRMSFKNIVFNQSNPKDWREKKTHLDSDEFYNDNMGSLVTGTSLAEVAERKNTDKTKTFLLLNFVNSLFKDADHIEIIKNGNVNIKINCLETIESTKKWMEDNCSHESILKDEGRFTPTSRVSVLGTKIYEEGKTQFYWYFDNFHKTHFEVFDSTKIHLGEGDLLGNLDRGKSDSRKNGKIDI